MVEFAVVGLLFVMLLSGLISFGLILSFKQNLTQAAAEGARAGATAVSGESLTDAATATGNAVASFDQTCNSGGLTCTFELDDCGEDPRNGIDNPAIDQCIYVTVVYDYENHPLLPRFPVLSALYPDTVSSGSSSVVNP